jgi:hypothetical protein
MDTVLFDGDALRRLMYERGFAKPNVAAFARATGVTEAAIRHYLTGWRTPAGPELAKLARELDRSVWDLMRTECA